jgi:ABC-type ATPase involved in cell division
VADTLDRFQIVGKGSLSARLSGGQQQLVGVARAIIQIHGYSLDAHGQPAFFAGKRSMELFKKLNAEGTTIIQVTHWM